ncbi:hypothetical protein P280DRAFT_5284 [Massarina eburnea CBS 473.64]|uniref:Uncharacterized protein n=1 Tax=Massarina eburnea CBS 473.64 TaxID=1395130 RepID=A0A6A6SEI7_9PLEO|nr:hypothetical protein P280DRAFT_5284 [Massarina eburnea CBS 473.64]
MPGLCSRLLFWLIHSTSDSGRRTDERFLTPLAMPWELVRGGMAFGDWKGDWEGEESDGMARSCSFTWGLALYAGLVERNRQL